MKSTPTYRRKRGFVTIYVLFTSLTLIPVVGLAIDFSVLYNVKARLQTAVDAGCIAAGYTLQRTTDMTDPTQIAAIQSTAQSFFNANYPAGYWGSTQASYSATPATGANNTRTIAMQASEYVPLLFLRVLGISHSTVTANATVTVRFLTMIVVVDRSGSVVRGGNKPVVESALTQFIGTAGTSPFVDGRDVIGLLSFGATTHFDLSPTSSFRSGTPSFSSAVSTILDPEFGNNPTNTVDGLYQAYSELQTLNQTGALNVIVLLTDGRPSAFTASYTIRSSSSCTDKTSKTGVITANVASDFSWPPPTCQGCAQGTGGNIFNMGIVQPNYTSMSGGTDMQIIGTGAGGNPAGCSFASSFTNIPSDVATFPGADIHGNDLTSGYYLSPGSNMNNPQSLRYSSFNAADNQATKIRQDTTLRPVLFVIGLNEPVAGGEQLDADWLARVANDPNYKDSLGNPVFQTGQTPGMYYNVSGSGLAAAFQDIASQILRLSQ
jgi:Flp pilus assembly protein TadG